MQDYVGKILVGEHHKDAIHIPVMPVFADEIIVPGAKLAKSENPKKQGFRVKTAFHPSDAIGICDPYLRTSTRIDDQFLMFLFPGTVTNLRHDWTHPNIKLPNAPKAESTKRSRDYSKKWLQDLAKWAEIDFMFLMQAMKESHEKEDMVDLRDHNHATDMFRMMGEEKQETMWFHFENYTGIEVDTYAYFRCSC